ncbi:MAG: hypothetical protein WBA97_07440 [Actinophytocola sp.]|uniref:hypothetical protein n=1 Tax=Actinophytocola sp. TaxID=1872138 RepID=UPI003C7729CD
MTESAYTPKQIEIVSELETVGRAITEHARLVLMGEAVDWATLAEQLAAAARLCRRQAATPLTDIGDSGGR